MAHIRWAGVIVSQNSRSRWSISANEEATPPVQVWRLASARSDGVLIRANF
jgi:hypothetical protein